MAHALHRRDERPRATRYAAQEDLIEGFTKKYGVHRLVYYEMHPTMDAAILREKRLKEWRRLWKIRSIESMNPEWIDLFDERTGEILDGPADLSRTR
jgi:putative endonuclease